MTRADLDELEHQAGEYHIVRWPQERILELIGRIRELMDEVDGHAAGAEYSVRPATAGPSPGQLWADLLATGRDARLGRLQRLLAGMS